MSFVPDGYSHIPSPEEQERVNMYLAVELARRQLEAGTARAQVITHYLDMSSPRENIERRMMEAKINHLEGQLAAMQDDRRILEMIEAAMRSLSEYRGEEQYEDIF